MPKLSDLIVKRKREQLAREMTHIPQEPYYNPIGDAITQWGSGVQERIGALGRSAATLGDLASWQQAGRNLGEVNNMLTADPTLAMDAINPSGLVGMFAGKGAKTANLAMLSKAEEMAKAGIPDYQIWKETGWTLDTPDKLPRFEIPDNEAMYRGTYPASSAYADRAMHHPELMKGYPDIGAIRFDSNADVAGGSYVNQGADEVISIGGKEGIGSGSTALHELQHAIQQREGFATGGSPGLMKASVVAADPKIVSAASQIRDMAKKYGISVDDIIAKPPKYLRDDVVQDAVRYLAKNDEAFANAATRSLDPNEAYKRLAGEAEARLTQSRMAMTPEQRLAQYPYEPEYFQGATGVNLKDLIVRNDGGIAMSIPERNITQLMTDAEKAMIQYELSKMPRKPAVRLRDLAIGGGALGAGGLAGYYGIGKATE